MVENLNPTPKVAVIPLVPRQATEDGQWLGILIAKLLAEHLLGAGLQVAHPNHVAQQIRSAKLRLPLNPERIEPVRSSLKADVLIHGSYAIDEEGKMLGVKLLAESPDLPRVPLEVAAPLAGFERFIERISLAVVEQIGLTVTEVVRGRIHDVPRPANFEAYRQLSRAYAAWARQQNELALTAVSSARTLDPTFEEITALQVAIARMANDAETVEQAFMHWVDLARNKKQFVTAGQRMLQLGHWLTERGEWTDARKIYDEARKLFHDAKNEHGISQALNNQANLDLARGKFQAAIQAYRRSLHVFESNPAASLDSATTYYNLSLAHKHLGQREEATRALEQALAGARRLKNMELEALCLAQRGAIHDDAGEWKQAQIHYEQAARFLDVVGNDQGRAIIISHQAMLLKQQGAYERAGQLLKEAEKLLPSQSAPHIWAVLWLDMADLYLAMADYEQAWEYAQQAHDNFEEIESEWQSITQELLDTLDELTQEPEEPDEEEDEISSPFPQSFESDDLPATTTTRRPPTVSSNKPDSTLPRSFGGASPFVPDEENEDEQ